MPSSKSEPKARFSANDQSTVPRDSMVLTRAAKIRDSLGLTMKPAGGRAATSVIDLSTSYETPVSTVSNEYRGVRLAQGPVA